MKVEFIIYDPKTYKWVKDFLYLCHAYRYLMRHPSLKMCKVSNKKNHSLLVKILKASFTGGRKWKLDYL